MELILKALLVISVAVVAYLIVRYWKDIVKFVSEVKTELTKVSWSTRKELMEATWLILLSSAFLGVYIGAADFVLSKIVGLLIK